MNYPFYFRELWELFHSFTFDGPNKLAIINPGVNYIDLKEDLYSPWKQWVRVESNSKFIKAMRTTGGDPSVGGKYLGYAAFMTNGWKITDKEDNGIITINGTIFSDEAQIYGEDPFVDLDSSIRFTTSEVVLVSGDYSSDIEDIRSGQWNEMDLEEVVEGSEWVETVYDENGAGGGTIIRTRRLRKVGSKETRRTS